MGLDGTLLDAKFGGDFSVGTGQQNKFEDLVLARGEVRGGDGEADIGDRKQPVNEFGEDTAGRPDGAIDDGIEGVVDLLRPGGRAQIGACAGDDGIHDQIVVAVRANDDEAQGGPVAANALQDFKAGADRDQVEDQVVEFAVLQKLLERAAPGLLQGPVDDLARAQRKAAMLGTEAARKQVVESVGNVLVGLLVPAIRKVQDAEDRATQTDRNVRVAFALAAYHKENKQYPQTLDVLAPRYIAAVPGDVFSGGRLLYRREGAGYVAYSVGLNGKDDGGRWLEDEPRGDDPRVRMPVVLPKR